MILSDVLSMTPFFVLAYIVKNPYLAGVLFLIALAGIIHHIYVQDRSLLILDKLTILLGFLVIGLCTDISDLEKQILFVLILFAMSALVYIWANNIQVSKRVGLLISSTAWLPFIIFIIPKLSTISKVFVYLSLVFYMWNTCVCNKNERMSHVTWGCLHVIASIAVYFGLRDTGLLKPEFVL